MGVDISSIVERVEINIESLSGKRIAIDAYNAIYQFVSAIRQADGRPLSDTDGRPTSHLIGILHRNLRLLQAGIKPVYVFDGAPNRLKFATLQKRKEAKMRAEDRYREAIEKKDMERAYSLAMQTTRLTDEMIAESIRLLTLMGIPFLIAPEDGEAQASHMARQGNVWATASQDFDTLLFGSPRTVRNLTLSSRRRIPGKGGFSQVKLELVDLEYNLRKLGLSREQMIDMAILVGTDFNEGIMGIGPKKALKIMLENKSIENTKYVGLPGLDHLDAVRRIFIEPAFTDDYRLEWKRPDGDGIVDFLCTEHEFDKQGVEQAVASLNSIAADNQQSLDRWM
ncbi:MAG: flap endonuclease-1 [Thermoplasmata archaeon]|nr:flap endonuclease-1 [Candidatus Sysuiplasma acidicola]MBX8645469.1 flap endonuclease-1 [Candidatus Sysuiplasma acidicola]